MRYKKKHLSTFFTNTLYNFVFPFDLAQDILQGLVLSERIETIIPLTYILCLLMGYYGPNAEVLIGFKLSIWEVPAIEEFGYMIQILSLLFLVDFGSFVLNAIFLWFTCKINLLSELKTIQKNLWMMMALTEAFTFMSVGTVLRGFLTPDLFHSTSLVSWRSSRVSKAAKFFKELNLQNFSCCFSARIEQSSKTTKIEMNYVILG